MIAVAAKSHIIPPNFVFSTTASFSFCNTSLIPHSQFPQIMANTITQSTKDRLWSVIESYIPAKNNDDTLQKMWNIECFKILQNGLPPKPVISDYTDEIDFKCDVLRHNLLVKFHQFLCDNNFL
jgi:hypothetical protein